MATGERTSPWNVVLGLAVLGLFGWGLFSGVAAVWRWSFPEPRVTAALSASFVGSPAVLRIQGRVQEAGKPVAAGTAKLTIEWLNGPFLQTMLLEIKNGQFEVSGAQPFEAIPSTASLRIDADVELSSGPRVREELYLNTPRPQQTGLNLLTRATFVLQLAGWITLVFTAMFFWAFTGAPSLVKNQVAIILSYCMIIVALAVPMITPVVLPVLFPSVETAMHDAAVGIVVARPYSTDGKAEPQWSLNIGGYVRTRPAAETSLVAATSEFGAPPTRAASSAATDAPAVPRSPAVITVAQQDPPAAQPPAPSDVTPAAGVLADPTEQGRATAPSRDPSKEVSVLGGVVVPLYVLLLSVIGGAINMTRQVPKFQEQSDLFGGRWFVTVHQQVARHLMKFVRTPHGNTVEQVDKTTVTEAVDTQSGIGDPPPEALPADATTNNGWAEWRAGLLGQYMYLLSAPFLAIATYHLLASLDLIRQPIVVLVSFSIGLISEKVIQAILRVAENILGKSEPDGPSPQPEGA